VIGVLIVDDEALFRKVLAIAFGRQAGIEVLGQCADGTEASAAARRLRPDVVLMDLHMPGTCGLQATRALLMAHPTARVIILTASPTKRAISDAADAGASGYLKRAVTLKKSRERYGWWPREGPHGRPDRALPSSKAPTHTAASTPVLPTLNRAPPIPAPDQVCKLQTRPPRVGDGGAARWEGDTSETAPVWPGSPLV